MPVVPFRRSRSGHRFARPVEPPAALTGEASAASRSASDAAEDRWRMLQNLAAFAVVVILLVLGTWLIDRLRAYSRTMACIESGHRSCMQLDTRQAH